MSVAPWSQLYRKEFLETLQVDQWPYAVSVVFTLRFTSGHCAKVQGSSFSLLLFFTPRNILKQASESQKFVVVVRARAKFEWILCSVSVGFGEKGQVCFFWGSRCVHRGLFQSNVQTAGVVDLSFWHGKRH